MVNVMARKIFVLLFFLFVFSDVSRVVSIESKDVPLESLFAYDAALPLHAKVAQQKETETYILYHVKFNSTHQEKVTALFTVPKNGKPPYPYLLFQHGLTNKKEYMVDWLGVDAAEMLAKEGIGVLSVDAPLHGERQKVGMKPLNIFGFGPYPYLARDSIVQAVVDLRRAVDFLVNRDEVDKNKICYLGESMGAILGGTFTAVEKRIRAVVLCAGGGGLQFLFETSLMGMKKQDIEKAMENFLYVVDPLTWIAQISPRPLLMVNATKDTLMPKDASERLYKKAKEPKKHVWLESEHTIRADLLFPVVIEWMKEQLGVNTHEEEDEGAEEETTEPVEPVKNESEEE